MKKINRTTCDFSCTDKMCETLDDAGVPAEGQWRSLILYLRDLSEHGSQSKYQQKQFQNLLLHQIKNKDYSPPQFKVLTHEFEQLISAPCLQQLESAISETAELLSEFKSLLAERRGDIQTLEKSTIDHIQSGSEPMIMLGEIRNAFHQIISTMDEDINELQTLSTIDPLTSLNNRRSLDEHLQKEVERARQKEITLSVIFLDIDHFKTFNDNYGHRIGDQALSTVASIMTKCLQNLSVKKGIEFFACRYGGEEFAILLSNCTEDKAQNIAELIRLQLENYNFIIRNKDGEISKKNIQITASFGVAELQLDDWQEPLCEYLLDAADKSMYQAKQSGRNRVHCHSRTLV